MLLPSPWSTLFPYTTLFRSLDDIAALDQRCGIYVFDGAAVVLAHDHILGNVHKPAGEVPRVRRLQRGVGDRKRTRLNSSHTVISYAVFCLKKKKTKKKTT